MQSDLSRPTAWVLHSDGSFRQALEHSGRGAGHHHELHGDEDAAAGANEILVSATTRALAGSSKLEFRSAGVRTLKGLTGDWELFAYVDDDGRAAATS